MRARYLLGAQKCSACLGKLKGTGHGWKVLSNFSRSSRKKGVSSRSLNFFKLQKTLL